MFSPADDASETPFGRIVFARFLSRLSPVFAVVHLDEIGVILEQISAFHAIPVTEIATLSLKVARVPFARKFRIGLPRPQACGS